MYLSFNNYIKKLKIISTSIILVVVHSYFPLVSISNNLFLSIDFLFLYLTFLSLKSSRLYVVILLAFFIGIFKDFVIQNNTIGLYSFIKCCSNNKASSSFFVRAISKYLDSFIKFFIFFVLSLEFLK